MLHEPYGAIRCYTSLPVSTLIPSMQVRLGAGASVPVAATVAAISFGRPTCAKHSTMPRQDR